MTSDEIQDSRCTFERPEWAPDQKTKDRVLDQDDYKEFRRTVLDKALGNLSCRSLLYLRLPVPRRSALTSHLSLQGNRVQEDGRRETMDR